MRACRAFAGLIVFVALLAGSVADAGATEPPAGPALFATATGLPGELEMLGQDGGPGSLLGHPVSEIKFTNHDGFTITVVAFGQTVALGVGNELGRRLRSGATPPAPKRSSTTVYLAHGKVTPTSIQASFGDRGRIDLRFRPTGRRIRASKHAGCRRPSHATIAQLGLFVGELRFRGEGGYTSAEVHRVHGGLVDFPILVACALRGSPLGGGALSSSVGSLATAAVMRVPDVPSAGTHPSRGPKPTTLSAERKLPLSRTVFAARSHGVGEVRFLALSTGSEGSIGIVRLASASAPTSSFAFDDSLATAAVEPPAPFSGAGAFRQDVGGGKSWTGPLAVSFLGAPHVPLTGDEFVPQLSRGW
jgi:hypothetical protein